MRVWTQELVRTNAATNRYKLRRAQRRKRTMVYVRKSCLARLAAELGISICTRYHLCL